MAAKSLIANMTANAGKVPDKDKLKKRFPFLILVDVSPSMAGTSQPDIDKVNEVLPLIFDMVRNPPPSSELAGRAIDLAVMTYADTPELVMDWTISQNLPATVAPMTTTGNGTATALALKHSLTVIGQQLRYYRSEHIPWGMPNIIHITDGGINDAKPGDPMWQDLEARLSFLHNKSDPERPFAHIVNFVAPNGASGIGIQTMQALAGPNTTYQIDQGVAAIDNLVKIISRIVGDVTRPFGAKTSVQSASEHVDTDPNAGIHKLG